MRVSLLSRGADGQAGRQAGIHSDERVFLLS